MKTKNTIYDVIRNDDRFTILSKLLKSTGIGKAMSKEQDKRIEAIQDGKVPEPAIEKKYQTSSSAHAHKVLEVSY